MGNFDLYLPRRFFFAHADQEKNAVVENENPKNSLKKPY
jgi:hypothetical protein